MFQKILEWFIIEEDKVEKLNFGTFVGLSSALIISAIMYKVSPVPFDSN